MILTLLKSFLHWLYTQPLGDVLLLAVLLTGIFLLLQRRFGRCCWCRLVCGTLLLLWLAAVLWITLGNRGGEVWQTPVLTPFLSYRRMLIGENSEALRMNLMNMLLFCPAGLLTRNLLPMRWRGWKKLLLISGIGLFLSVVIESLQYIFHLGLAEMDDVIHNTLGVLLGALAAAATRHDKKI